VENSVQIAYAKLLPEGTETQMLHHQAHYILGDILNFISHHLPSGMKATADFPGHVNTFHRILLLLTCSPLRLISPILPLRGKPGSMKI
jgi:hypothetical protein